MQISGCQNLQTSEPINIKFGVCDYIGHFTRMPKFITIVQIGASRRMREISLSSGF